MQSPGAGGGELPPGRRAGINGLGDLGFVGFVGLIGFRGLGFRASTALKRPTRIPELSFLEAGRGRGGGVGGGFFPRGSRILCRVWGSC